MKLPQAILAVDHRIQLIDAAKQAGRDLETCRRFKELIVESYLQALRRSPALAERSGLILDAELGSSAIRMAQRAGITVGQPAEVSGVTPLQLIGGDEISVLQQRPDFVKCLVNGRPDDRSDSAAMQDRTVLKLSAACERAQVPLVLELIVSRLPRELPQVFDAQRAHLTAEWMRRLLALGVRPSEWKLEGFPNPSDNALIEQACGEVRRFIILGKSADEPTLFEWFKAGRTVEACRGFAVGRTIFWPPFMRYLAGASEDSVIHDVASRYLRIVELWDSSQA